MAIASLMGEMGRGELEVSLPIGRHIILNAIRRNRVKFASDSNFVVACDAKTTDNWRKKEFPYYKANRKKSKEDSIIPWDDVYMVINTVKEELKQFFHYPVLEIDGLEADDIIACLVAEEAAWGNPVTILSGDHDFLQLQMFTNITQYDPIKQKFVKPEGTPQQALIEHIIRGDTGDGVPNFLSDDDTFVNPDKRQAPIRKKNVAVWNRLTFEELMRTQTTVQHVNNLKRNKRLVDLTDPREEFKTKVLKEYESQQNKTKHHLMNYFVTNRLTNLIGQLQEF